MICSRCGFTDQEIFPSFTCPSCGSVYSSAEKLAAPLPVQKSFDDPIWESPDAHEFPLTAFIKTVKNLFLNPTDFFRQIHTKSHITSVWIFALIAGSIGYTFLFMWSQIFPENFTKFYNEAESFLATSGESSPAQTLLYTPLLVSIQLIFIALYTHFMLLITGNRKKSFKYTFKVTAYSQGALLLCVLPAIGSFCASIAMLFQIITGISAVHGISKLKALMALILPLLVLLSLVALILLLLAIFGIAASGVLDQLAPFLSN